MGPFVKAVDLGRVADDLRELKPGALLVDDAHRKLDLLLELRRLRDEIHADCRIIPDSWPGAKDDVAATMMISGPSCRELPLLIRDQIVEVVNEAGIAGPTRLVGEIVDQAAGRPGLAVTLAHLCLVGGVQDVVLGTAVARDITCTVKPLVGADAAEALAAFAVAAVRA